MSVSVELDGIFSPGMSERAEVNGVVIPSGIILRRDPDTTIIGERVEHKASVAMVISDEIDAIGAVCGNDGDILTIGEDEFVIMSITEIGNGISSMRLERCA